MSSIIYPGQKLALAGSSVAPASTPPAATVTPLVPSTFLGFSYPAAVVSSANQNKALLNASPVPSREQMKKIVADTARRMGVDPSLALAFAFQESSFDHRSVSPANAIGTMQVIPSSGEWASDLVGRKLNLLDPYDNATAGVAIIRQLIRTSKDRTPQSRVTTRASTRSASTACTTTPSTTSRPSRHTRRTSARSPRRPTTARQTSRPGHSGG